jgi:inorganic pyrophosphatase
VNDPEYDSYQEARELPPHRLAVLKRFFEDYKVLEHKEVIVGEILPARKALPVIKQSLTNYRSQFRPRVK